MASPWLLPRLARFVAQFGGEGGKEPTRLAVLVAWLLAAAFALAIGWFRNINLLVLLGYLLAAVPLLNLLAARWTLLGLRARRRIAQPVYAGIPCAVHVRIAPTRGRARLGVRVEDAGPDHRLSWFVERLERTGHWLRGQVVLPRRGRYAWGPATASSGYPFGLVQRSKMLAPAEEIIVLPRVGRLHRGLFRRLLLFASFEADRRRRMPHRHAAAQDQFHGLRPFRAGDNPRAVHWRTSARRGEWMVREFEDLPGENLLLVFDCALYSGDGLEPFSRERLDDFEAAVSLAATIAVEWRGDRGGRLIAAVTGQDPVVLDGPAGPAHGRRVLERLAVVEPLAAPSAPANAGLLAQLAAVPSAGVVVVAAGRSRLADALRQALRRPVACLEAAALRDLDFYEPPDSGVRSQGSGIGGRAVLSSECGVLTPDS
jgi:uncharacterized protein (DUF58 family)